MSLSCAPSLLVRLDFRLSEVWDQRSKGKIGKLSNYVKPHDIGIQTINQNLNIKILYKPWSETSLVVGRQMIVMLCILYLQELSKQNDTINDRSVQLMGDAVQNFMAQATLEVLRKLASSVSTLLITTWHRGAVISDNCF